MMKSNLVRLAAAIVILLIAGLLIYKTMLGAGITYSNPAYFLDTGSGKIYIAQAGAAESLRAPSGSAGLRATAYSCGDCADVSQLQPGVAMKVAAPAGATDAGGSSGLRPSADAPNAGLVQQLIASPQHLDQWVDAHTPEGDRLVADMTPKCTGGKPAKLCKPQAK